MIFVSNTLKLFSSPEAPRRHVVALWAALRAINSQKLLRVCGPQPYEYIYTRIVGPPKASHENKLKILIRMNV